MTKEFFHSSSTISNGAPSMARAIDRPIDLLSIDTKHQKEMCSEYVDRPGGLQIGQIAVNFEELQDAGLSESEKGQAAIELIASQLAEVSQLEGVDPVVANKFYLTVASQLTVNGMLGADSEALGLDRGVSRPKTIVAKIESMGINITPTRYGFVLHKQATYSSVIRENDSPDPNHESFVDADGKEIPAAVTDFRILIELDKLTGVKAGGKAGTIADNYRVVAIPLTFDIATPSTALLDAVTDHRKTIWEAIRDFVCRICGQNGIVIRSVEVSEHDKLSETQPVQLAKAEKSEGDKGGTTVTRLKADSEKKRIAVSFSDLTETGRADFSHLRVIERRGLQKASMEREQRLARAMRVFDRIISDMLSESDETIKETYGMDFRRYFSDRSTTWLMDGQEFIDRSVTPADREGFDERLYEIDGILSEKCDGNEHLLQSLYTMYKQSPLTALKSVIAASYGDVINSNLTTQTIDVEMLGEGKARASIDFHILADRPTTMAESKAIVHAGSEMRVKADIEIDGATITMRDMTCDVILANGFGLTPRPPELVDAA